MANALVLSAVIAGCCSGLADSAASASDSLELTEYGLIAEVQIGTDNPEDYRMILDTGAAMSVLNSVGELPDDAALVQEVNVAGNTAARIRAGIYRSGFIRFGTNEFNEALFLAIDLSGRPGPFANGIDGILSPQFMTSGYLEIDFATATYRVYESIDPEWGEPIPFGENNLPIAVIDIAGQSVEVILDSGASGFLLLPDSMSSSLPLETVSSASGHMATVTGEAQLTEARLSGDVIILNRVIENPTLEFSSDIDQAIMGLAGLSGYRLILDSTRKQSWLIPENCE